MRAVELFSGAGGMSRGLIDAGYEIVGAYDAWPVAVENYRANIGYHAKVADLKDLLSIIPEISHLRPEMIFGGPPCQDYSMAGCRKEGENARMTVAFAIVVATVRPRWFLMENVAPVATSAAWAEARMILECAGYGLSQSKINASLYGVPQSRKRLYVTGRLDERDGFLESAIAARASARPMTLRALFGPDGPSTMYFPARSKARRSIWSADEPAPTIRERTVRPIPATYKPVPADAALLENGYVYSRPMPGAPGVRSIDGPFPTVTRTSCERPGPKYLANPHPLDPVPATTAAAITKEQASRIQGFPEDWRWVANSQRDIHQMIANAVPAPVAKAIGEVILARDRGYTIPAIEGRFVDWLENGGRSRAMARNVKASLNRARRLLRGRTFADLNVEIATLEATAEFIALRKSTRSDLRQALRLHSKFLASKATTRRGRRRKKVPAADAVEQSGLGKPA